MDATQHRVLVSVILAFCLWGAIGVLTGALLPDIMASFRLSATQAGFLISFWSVSFVVGSWISAKIVNHYRLNTIFIVASTATLVALIVLYKTQKLLFFLPAFGAVGAMMGVSVTIGHSLIGISFPIKRTAMLGVLDVIFTLGSILAPLGVISVTSGGLDWKFLYLILSISFGILIIILWFYLPSVSASQEQGGGNKLRLVNYINKPYLAFLGLTGLFLGTVEWAQNSWIVTYALGQNSTEFMAQVAFATYLGGMLAARVLTIFSSDWLQRGGNSIYILALALIGNVILLFSPGIPNLITGNFLVGFGIGAIFPVALGRAMDFNSKEAAISSATLLMGVISGSQIAALFLGWLSDQFGSIAVAFRATTPFFILLIGCYVMFRLKTAPIKQKNH